jgi:hypothetical protein
MGEIESYLKLGEDKSKSKKADTPKKGDQSSESRQHQSINQVSHALTTLNAGISTRSGGYNLRH